MKELQEQVRDLMFYLETQKKVAASSDGTRQVRERNREREAASLCCWLHRWMASIAGDPGRPGCGDSGVIRSQWGWPRLLKLGTEN